MVESDVKRKLEEIKNEALNDARSNKHLTILRMQKLGMHDEIVKIFGRTIEIFK